MLLLSSTDFFSELNFSKNSFRNTICIKVSDNNAFCRLANSLDPNQSQQNIRSDLDSIMVNSCKI